MQLNLVKKLLKSFNIILKDSEDNIICCAVLSITTQKVRPKLVSQGLNHYHPYLYGKKKELELYLTAYPKVK